MIVFDKSIIVLLISACIAILIAVTLVPDMVTNDDDGSTYGRTVLPYYYSLPFVTPIHCEQQVIGRFIATKC